MLVTLMYATLYLSHVVGAQMCHESGIAGYAFQKLALGVLPRETQAYEVGGRQASGAFRRERSFTVEGIVGIHGPSFLMGGY